MVDRNWGEEFKRLLALIHEEFPDVAIRPKTGFFMTCLHWVVVIVTLGQIRDFRTDYTTTIGHTIWVPSDWANWAPVDNYAVLLHEWQHLKQQRGWWLPCWLLAYLLLWLPCWRSLFRWRWERQAFGVQLEFYYYAHGLCGPNGLVATKLWAIAMLSGSCYLWAWDSTQVQSYFDDISVQAQQIDRDQDPLTLAQKLGA